MAFNATQVNDGHTYLDEVKKIVENARFGNVTLIIQDGKVIQIDKTEKIRL